MALADYELMPNMAIVDTDNMMSAPKGLTCASGIDVMTHAIEAYVSIMASDYTDSLALKAIKLVFDYLPRAYRDGSDVEAKRPHGKCFLHGRYGFCQRLPRREPLSGA